MRRLNRNQADAVDRINKDFYLSKADLSDVVSSFRSEMRHGLQGARSDLKMIPAYVSCPSGNEKGRFIALDLGGTNFRILELELKGRGRTLPPRVTKFTLEKRQMTGTGDILFDFIAGCVEKFIKKNKIDPFTECRLGFTFSFPVKQTGLASGQLVCWTKGFSAKGVVGRDVVAYLRRALAKRGLFNVKVLALANDTVGTLVAGSYYDRTCDIGVIIGTGTNACYPEKVSNIRKAHGDFYGNNESIVNIEWGNFSKIKRTRYDKLLDRLSSNPGEQILEKMVSGMYLGEIVRLTLADLKKQGILFTTPCTCLKKKGIFKTEHVSSIELDRAPFFGMTKRILQDIGIRNSQQHERETVYAICHAVSQRGARIAAAAILGVILKIDAGLVKKHTIAIDGSVYEKHPFFKDYMKAAFRELVGSKSSRIKMVLTKDGSGKGAAIIAAVAYTG